MARFGLSDSSDEEEEDVFASPPPSKRRSTSPSQSPSPSVQEQDDDEDDTEDGPPRGSLFYSDQSEDEDDEDRDAYSMDQDDGGVSREVTPAQKRKRQASHTPNRLSHQPRSRRSASFSSASSSSSSTASVPPLFPPRRSPSRRSVSNAPLPTKSSEPTPWPKTLKLEPKRVAVMQASLFQQPPSAKEREKSVPVKEKTPWAPSAPLSKPDTTRPVSNNTSKTGYTSAPIIDPAPFRQFRKVVHVPLSSSITSSQEGSRVDAGLALGRSFRVGWGPAGDIVHIGSLYGATPSTGADVLTVTKFKTTASPLDANETTKRLQTLELQLSHTPVYSDPLTQIPYAVPHPLLRFSHFCISLSPLDRSPEAQLWRLGHALFDEIEDLSIPQDATAELVRRLTDIRRRDRLEKWLEDAVRGEVEDDLRDAAASDGGKDGGAKRIFTLLSGHQLERACQAAIEAKDFRLATLLAQAGGDDSFREDVYLQLSKWREHRVDSHISKPYRRIYELLCGNVGISEGAHKSDVVDRSDDIFIAEGLDWKRAFGLHLWYGTFQDPLEVSVERYEQAASESQNRVAPPLPLYLEKKSSSSSTPSTSTSEIPADPLFELIKLFTSPTHPLEQSLIPQNFGSSPLDYRLPWHLYILFSRVLRRRDFEERVEVGESGAEAGVEGNSVRADLVTESFASQLEKDGYWQWGIFVLLHLELPERRAQAIQENLDRNVAAIDLDAFEFLTETLKLPPTWIYSSQAMAEKYNGDIFSEYKLLLAAEKSSEAHELVVSFLAPEALVRGDLVLLRRLLDPFNPRLVSNWDAGGKIFLDYVDCVEELQGGFSSPRLKAVLLSLIHTVPSLAKDRTLPWESPESATKPSMLQVCIAEMQSRLTVISSSLDEHLNEIKASTLQEADRLVWLQAVNGEFFENSLRDAQAAGLD